MFYHLQRGEETARFATLEAALAWAKDEFGLSDHSLSALAEFGIFKAGDVLITLSKVEGKTA
jgi:hypothetical protein